MKIKKDIFEIFERDESFKYIMKRLLEASMEEYFNSLAISDTSPFKKISAISSGKRSLGRIDKFNPNF